MSVIFISLTFHLHEGGGLPVLCLVPLTSFKVWEAHKAAVETNMDGPAHEAQELVPVACAAKESQPTATCARCLTKGQIKKRKEIRVEAQLGAGSLERTAAAGIHPCTPPVYAFVERLLKHLLAKLDDKNQVLGALQQMVENYKRQSLVQSLDGGNDYSTPAMQIAYIFKYMLSHCSVVRIAFSQSRAVSQVPELAYAIRESKILRVVSIGGGPGSDFLGLLSHLKDSNMMHCSVEVCLVDSCSGWFDIQQMAATSAKDSGWKRVFLTPIQQNVLQPLSEELKERLRKCNVITFVKVVSSLIAAKNCEKALVEILKLTPIGCVLLYVDNCAAKLSKAMHDAAGRCGFINLSVSTGHIPTIPCFEKKLLERHLGSFVNEWGQTVQMMSPMWIALFRKIDDDPRLLCMDMNRLPFVIKRHKVSNARPHPLSRGNQAAEEKGGRDVIQPTLPTTPEPRPFMRPFDEHCSTIGDPFSGSVEVPDAIKSISGYSLNRHAHAGAYDAYGGPEPSYSDDSEAEESDSLRSSVSDDACHLLKEISSEMDLALDDDDEDGNMGLDVREDEVVVTPVSRTERSRKRSSYVMTQMNKLGTEVTRFSYSMQDEALLHQGSLRDSAEETTPGPSTPQLAASASDPIHQGHWEDGHPAGISPDDRFPELDDDENRSSKKLKLPHNNSYALPKQWERTCARSRPWRSIPSKARDR